MQILLGGFSMIQENLSKCDSPKCFACGQRIGEPSIQDNRPIEAMYKMPESLQKELKLETPYFCSLANSIECGNISFLGLIELVEGDSQ